MRIHTNTIFIYGPIHVHVICGQIFYGKNKDVTQQCKKKYLFIKKPEDCLNHIQNKNNFQREILEI